MGAIPSPISIEFQTLATDSGWEGRALVNAFLHSLSEAVKDELLTCELPEDLDRIVALAIINSRTTVTTQVLLYSSPIPSPTPSSRPLPTPTPVKTELGPEPEVMMVDRSRLAKEERDRRVRTRACLVLWRSGTLCLDQPGKRAHPLVERGALVGIPIESSTYSRTCLPVTLNWTGCTRKTSALLDSGAEESFLDAEAAARWGIPLVEVSHPLVANSLNGQNIGRITKATVPLHLLISGNHQETITLLIIDTPHSPVIHPWMVMHSPEVDWKRHEIMGWSPVCSTRCLQKAHSLAAVPRLEEAPNLAKVPVEYHDLREVFCKSRATCLPPHRPYDCAIDLPQTRDYPRGPLFSLSQPETEAMEKYLGEALTAGIIRPSSSPAGAGFFFVGKKDGSLRPCIDDRGINEITDQEPVFPPLDDDSVQTPARSYYFHEAGPMERLSPGSHQRRG